MEMAEDQSLDNTHILKVGNERDTIEDTDKELSDVGG